MSYLHVDVLGNKQKHTLIKEGPNLERRFKLQCSSLANSVHHVFELRLNVLGDSAYKLSIHKTF